MGSLAQDSWMPQPPNDDLHKYKWSSSVTEDRSADATATWGAAFNYKPSQYHLQGDAQCWKKHIERVNSNEAYPSDDPMDRPVRMRNFEHMLATVNKGTVRVYHVTAKKRPRLLVYFPDANAEEELYAVAWVFNADFRKRWWVLAGGKLRKLRVIDVRAKRTVMNLKGHGEAIYDVKVHPRDPSLVLTASKDESLRLWNLRIGATVAIFSGLMGHRGEVVSVDFDRFGHRFASSSIDNSVRIWDITSDARVVNAICASHEAADAKKPFSRVEYVKGPAFVTRQVHKHYVDCVMWVGNALVSKSLNDVTYLWTPGADYASLASISTDFTLLQEYRVTGCDVWFIRFGLDSTRRIIALGGKKGIVHIFDMMQMSPRPITAHPSDVYRNSVDNYVRQCAFSHDGRFLVSVDDATNVVQYERVNKTKASRQSKPSAPKPSAPKPSAPKTSAPQPSPPQPAPPQSSAPLPAAPQSSPPQPTPPQSSPSQPSPAVSAADSVIVIDD